MHGAIGIPPQQFTNAPYVITTTPHCELEVPGPKFDLNASTRKVDNLMSRCRDSDMHAGYTMPAQVLTSRASNGQIEHIGQHP